MATSGHKRLKRGELGMDKIKRLLKRTLPQNVIRRGSILRSRLAVSSGNNLFKLALKKRISDKQLADLESKPNIEVYQSLMKQGYYCVRYPSTLAIFLTTHCNLNCFICRREGFRGQHMEFHNLSKLESAIKFAKTIDLTGWGEPLVYPKFENALNYICSVNPGQVIQFTTNGTRLSEHYAKLLAGHLQSVIISVNAATESTYNRDMQRGDFQKTLGAIRSFLSALGEKDLGRITFHFVAHTKNFHELPDFVALAHTFGVRRVSFGNYLINMKAHVPYSLLNVKEEWNDLVARASKIGDDLGVAVTARRFFHEKERQRELCLSPFEEVFVLPSGDVGPCCFSGNHYLGNAFGTSFEDVWFGAEYRKLRERRHLPACRTCNVFMPFDSFYTHFTGDFRTSEAFREVERMYSANRKV
jgi:MoaA/NifB/PqqE/SkfB family radical SAM enzyme